MGTVRRLCQDNSIEDRFAGSFFPIPERFHVDWLCQGCNVVGVALPVLMLPEQRQSVDQISSGLCSTSLGKDKFAGTRAVLR